MSVRLLWLLAPCWSAAVARNPSEIKARRLSLLRGAWASGAGVRAGAFATLERGGGVREGV